MRRQRPLLAMASARLGPLVEDVTFARLCRSRDFLAASVLLPVRLTDAAGEAYLLPFHYHRMFARAFGETPHDFVQRLRIHRAKELLDAETSEMLRTLIRKGVLGSGVLETADCQKTYEELKGRGVEFLSPPTERFYGIEALLKDNSANWFSMSQRKPAETGKGAKSAQG
jgi:AraC-like DNA-binding protein